MRCIGICFETNKIAVLKREKHITSLLSVESDVQLFYKWQGFPIFSGLSGGDVFIRKLLLPLKERKQLLAALPFQLESLLPYPPEQAVVYSSIQKNEVTFFATMKEKLQGHLDKANHLRISLESASCAPNALMRFAHYCFPEHKGKLLSFFPFGETLLYILSEDNRLLFSQTFLEKPSLGSLEKICTFLKQKQLLDEATPWFLAGEAGDSSLFSTVFLGQKLESNCSAEELSAALAIGYGLEGLTTDGTAVEFCQGEFTPKQKKTKRKKLGLLYLAACLGCAFLLSCLDLFMVENKKKELSLNMQQEMPAYLLTEEKLSLDSAYKALYEWEKLLNQQRSAFPFLVTLPKVSDILAWLSTHPSFTQPSGDPIEGIELHSLRYKMEKYPKIGEPNHPYRATLSLEFTAETPRLARHFHEALLKGDEIVDEKKEIRWHTQNQRYFTTFELKKVRAP